ncbi:MAG TPA: SDR family oxidoreductase [bacterium]|nr:SDR family oxidoreductase [bacterium]
MRAWLVTGGAGFIGSNLVEALLKKGERVRVVDSFITGKEKNLAPFKKDIELIRGDLREPGICRAAAKGIDVVLHQAALGSVPRSIEDPTATHESNVTATLYLLIAARNAQVQRFVCASSSSIYGANPALPKKENMAQMPLSPYAVSKLAQEQYCMAFHASYGLDTVALRYFNIYGPRQDPDSQYAAVVPRFIRAALAGKSPVIFGNGRQTRDFTFVADCVAANIAAAESPAAAGRFINIAAAGETSVLDLWNIIRDLCAAKVEAVHAEPRQGEVKNSRADVSLARELLAWEPRTSLKDGLRQTVEWMKSGG